MAGAKLRARPKRPFDPDEAVRRLRKAVAGYPNAALFQLATEGHDSVFETLVACVLSIRTLDEVTVEVARALFARGRTAEAIADLPVAEIDRLIRRVTFHGPKAATIREIARRTAQDFGGVLPCDPDLLQTFHGVGPKCANLAVGIACDEPLIGVDVHVHRVTNRWGLVSEPTPEKTMAALQAVLPRKYWVEINALLVPFGKHVCTGILPKCSTCPMLSMCRRVGVTEHR